MATLTSLTPNEKLAGRVFLAERQALLALSFESDPPDYKVLPWHKVYRHPCPKRGGISTALELHEEYTLSPEYVVFSDGRVEVARNEHNNPEFEGLIASAIPPGRFGFIVKQGRCRGCGKTARSKTGRFVDAHQRPKLEGRASR